MRKENNLMSVLSASILGSVIIMPGFIAFPLSGILLKEGATYMVLAAFTASLMMVGVITLPLEKEYFGIKIAVVRNLIGFFTAIIVSIVIGLVYGEITI